MADHFDLILIGSDLSVCSSTLHSPQFPLTVKSSVKDLRITIPRQSSWPEPIHVSVL